MHTALPPASSRTVTFAKAYRAADLARAREPRPAGHRRRRARRGR